MLDVRGGECLAVNRDFVEATFEPVGCTVEDAAAADIERISG